MGLRLAGMSHVASEPTKPLSSPEAGAKMYRVQGLVGARAK